MPSEMMNEYVGVKCQCGKVKKPRTAFCLTCFRKLPMNNRRGLSTAIGQAYEAAYQAALEILQS